MASLKVNNLVLKIKELETPSLKNITTTFESGKITAIMGPNGSGKTTLFNALIGITDADIETSGEILYNNEERDPKTWFDEATLVNQFGCPFPAQTVKEILGFVNKFSKSKIRDSNSVKELYSYFQIEKLLHKNYSVLSGGEQKRVRIVRDLLMKKKVIILDEPFSDLDSITSDRMARYLKDYAVSNDAIVIMTVHQVDPTVFEQFDKLVFLYEGHKIYAGKPTEFESFLKKENLQKPEKMSILNFAFEIFSDLLYTPQVKAMSENIEKLKKKLCPETKEHLEHLSYNGQHDILKFDFSFKSYCILVKRFINLSLKSFPFLIGLCLSIGLCFGLTLSMTSELKVTNYMIKGVKDPSRYFIFINNAMAFRSSLILVICMFGNNMNLLNPMAMQLKDEISKNFYSSFTLLISYLTFEIISNLFVGLIVLFLLLLTGKTGFLTLKDIPIILITFSFSFLDKAMANGLGLSNSNICVILSSLILVCGPLLPILYNKKVFDFIQNETLKTITQGILAVTYFILKPFTFLGYSLNFENLYYYKKLLLKEFTTEFVNEEINATIQVYNQSFVPIVKSLENWDIYKAWVLLFLSLTFVLVSYMMFFSNFFTPKTSLRNSLKSSKTDNKYWNIFKKKKVLLSIFFISIGIGIFYILKLRSTINANIVEMQPIN